MTIGAQILEYSRLTRPERSNGALQRGNGDAGSIKVAPAIVNHGRERQKSASA
jgi:hypothetical protein